MGKKSDDDTAVILKKLGIICPSFYAVYYVVVVVLALAFGLECDDKDSCRYYRLPFYFDEDDFRPEGADLALVAWLGQVVVFLLSTALMYYVVASTAKSWDYACTLAFLHLVVSCAVNASFPTNWVWWVTLALSTFTLSSLGEITCYARDMKDIVVEHSAEQD